MDTAQPTRVEKRNRPPVSCEPCRTRKLKCNRALPCDACSKRDKASQCHYAANAVRGKPSGPSKQRDMKARLESLENLISSFIPNDDAPSAPAVAAPNSIHFSQPAVRDEQQPSKSPEPTQTPELPRLKEAKEGQMGYVEPYHWRSILDDIKEVREHLTTIGHDDQTPESQDDSPPAWSDTLTAMSASGDPQYHPASAAASLDMILTTLPPQPICDKLLSWYFRAEWMVLGIVHPTKFQTEYAEFRKSPHTAQPLWVALLFSILSLAVSLRRIAGIIDSDESATPVQVLQRSAKQCLELGHYTTANEFAIEAFLLRIMSCFFSPGNNAIDMWFDLGATIQLAYRMGYHRDPDGLTGVSPFDGEMRRRVWINIFQLDCLVSFQLGYPSLIQAKYCDAKPPRNLEYADFSPETTVLPPARPPNDPTHTLYSISKVGCMSVFKKIVMCTMSLETPGRHEVLALDRELRQVYSNIPECYRPKDVGASLIDPAFIIWQRCSIEVLYYKSLVVLHRRFAQYDVPETPDSSRRAAAEAALGILSRQADMYMACEPGGRLYEERWMILAMPVHDFLMAAMVICLDLSVRLRDLKGESNAVMMGGSDPEFADREYQSLLRTRKIWAIRGRPPPHEAHAIVALDLMVKKVSDGDALWSNWGVGYSDYVNPMSQMIDGTENVDWDMLDHYLQNLDHLTFDNPVG